MTVCLYSYDGAMSTSPEALVVSRLHRTRLMQIWRSAGWPCQDGLEIDLLAAGLIRQDTGADGRPHLRLTDSGIQCLAALRQRHQRALSPHDRLGDRVARQLLDAGRIVWRELSLRAAVQGPEPVGLAQGTLGVAEHLALWAAESPFNDTAARAKASWRLARPDVFSVRNTSVEDYLQPVVHEVKVSRADLLSDLRHEAKRQSYQWLCAECYYVFPAGIAEPAELPEAFGVWLLHGEIDSGHLELARPARHVPCRLPFPVWLSLAKATPWRPPDDDPLQAALGDEGADPHPQARP